MHKLNLDIHDARLTAETAPQCSLSAVVGLDGLSFAVMQGSGEVWMLKSWHFPADESADFQAIETGLRQVFGSETAFELPFQARRWALFNAQATLTPRRFFDAGQLPDYFKLLLRPADHAYAYDALETMDSFLPYAVEPALLRLCEHYFQGQTPEHLAARLLKHWHAQSRPDHADVFVHFRPQHLQVAVFDRRQLLFYNAFPFAAANDVLYYLLLTLEQCRLPAADTPITLSGNLLRESEIFRVLSRGLGQLQFATNPIALHFPSGAPTLPGHLFADLFMK